MPVSSSSISQIPTLTLPSCCPCYRCGDVIAACSLEPRPSSCDPSLQKTESEWFFRRAEDTLGMMSVRGEPERSRRKSEEALHRLWESIDLSEPDQPVWWPFLPKWVKDDVVLCQIAGLPGIPQAKEESFSQTWDRLGREFEEREKLRPESSPPASRSSFTSSEDDRPRFDALKARIHRGSSQQVFIADRILKDSNISSSSLSLSPAADDSYRDLINSIAERARRQKRKLQKLGRHRNPQTGLCHRGDSSVSSSPKPDNLDRSVVIKTSPADSSTISPPELSPRMTPSSFSEPTHLSEEDKLSFTTAHVIKVYEPTPKLARRIPSPHSKSTITGLPVNPPSGHGLVTPISSPGEEEQFYLAGTTKENERGRQNHALSLDHNIIGKRRRAVSYPSVPDSPSPDDDGLTRSVRPRKRMWTRRAL